MCACAQDRLSRDYRAPPHLIVPHRSWARLAHLTASHRVSPLQQHHLVGVYGERYRLPAAREMPWIQFKHLDIHAAAINAVLGHLTQVSGLRNYTTEGGAVSSDLCLGMHTQ